jgi:hypothetical protein
MKTSSPILLRLHLALATVDCAGLASLRTRPSDTFHSSRVYWRTSCLRIPHEICRFSGLVKQKRNAHVEGRLGKPWQQVRSCLAVLLIDRRTTGDIRKSCASQSFVPSADLLLCSRCFLISYSEPLVQSLNSSILGVDSFHFRYTPTRRKGMVFYLKDYISTTCRVENGWRFLDLQVPNGNVQGIVSSRALHSDKLKDETRFVIETI